jgi:uncharacterized protein
VTRQVSTRRAVLALLGGFVIALSASALAQSRAPGEREALLIAAATRGDAATVKRLISEGVPLEARDSEGRTALTAATYGNHVDAALALIAAGADVNAQDALKNSAYLLSGARGHNEILKATLPRANFKSLNRFGGTALIPACHYGHIETVRILLATPTDINHVNNLGWTALMEAVILGDGGPTHTEIVRLLLGHKANPNIADREGITPLAHARKRGYREMVTLLTQGGGRN